LAGRVASRHYPCPTRPVAIPSHRSTSKSQNAATLVVVTSVQRHLGDTQRQSTSKMLRLAVKLAAQSHIRYQQMHFVIFGQSGHVSWLKSILLF